MRRTLLLGADIEIAPCLTCSTTPVVESRRSQVCRSPTWSSPAALRYTFVARDERNGACRCGELRSPKFGNGWHAPMPDRISRYFRAGRSEEHTSELQS